MYVITNHTRHPLHPSIPMEKTVDEKVYVERRDAEGKTVVVEEVRKKVRSVARTIDIPPSLPNRDVGVTVVSKEEYEKLAADPVFQRWMTPRSQGGEGLCTVSIDRAYARRAGDEKRAQDRAFKPAKPIVVEVDDEDFEEEEAPKPKGRGGRKPAASQDEAE